MKSELIRYGFWGVVTVGVNYCSYLVLQFIMPYQIANMISVVFTKFFAYYTNRKYVFKTTANGKEHVKEVTKYIMARSITGVLDFVGLIALTEMCGIDSRMGKMLMIVITTTLNYILGKLFVFALKAENYETSDAIDQ